MQLFFCKITQIHDHFSENGVTKYGREFRKGLYFENLWNRKNFLQIRRKRKFIDQFKILINLI